MINAIRLAVRIFMPRGHRLRWAAVVGLALLVAAAEYVAAILVFRVLDFATSDSEEPASSLSILDLDLELGWLLLLAGLAFLLRGLLGLASHYAQESMVQKSAGDVSSQLHRQYLYAPYTFHLERNSSELVRTAIMSVDRASGDVVRPMVTIVTQLPIMVTLLVLLVIISPLLTLGAVIVVGVSMALTFGLVQPRLRKLGRRSEEIRTALLKSLRDSFESIRGIKVFGAEPFFDDRFRKQRSIETRLRINRFVLVPIPKVMLEFIVIAGLLLLVGLVRGGESLTNLVPTLGVFTYATLRIVPSITRMVAAANSLKFGQQAILNVANDLEASGVAIPAAPSPLMPSPEVLFEQSMMLRNVSFTYSGGRAQALDSVDIEIFRGEMFVIVGPSGAGKSTLVDILLRLLTPESGSVLVDGSEVIPTAWRNGVGVVSQRVVLIDGSLRENVAFGAGGDADDEKVTLALEAAQLGDWLASLPDGLDTMVGESGKLVSGGERQRVAIARSLYRDPRLLILDEATSDVDAATESKLLRSLGSQSDRLTTVIVSHRLAPIQVADRVAMLDSGRIVAVGTFDELRSRIPEFRQLVGR